MREFHKGVKRHFLPSYVVRGALAKVAILFYISTTELPTIQQKLKNENARMKGCSVSRIQRQRSFCARDIYMLLGLEKSWSDSHGHSFYRLFVSLRSKVTYQKEERTASRWSTIQKLVVTLLRAGRRRKCMISMSRVEAK